MKYVQHVRPKGINFQLNAEEKKTEHKNVTVNYHLFQNKLWPKVGCSLFFICRSEVMLENL